MRANRRHLGTLRAMRDPRVKRSDEPPWPLKGSVFRAEIKMSMWKGTPEGPEVHIGAAYTEALDGQSGFRITVYDANWNVVYDDTHDIRDSDVPEGTRLKVTDWAVMRADWIAEGALWPLPKPEEPG